MGKLSGGSSPVGEMLRGNCQESKILRGNCFRNSFSCGEGGVLFRGSCLRAEVWKIIVLWKISWR